MSNLSANIKATFIERGIFRQMVVLAVGGLFISG